MGAVAKINPVLAALVILTPNVKAVWPTATPRHPRPATGRSSFRPQDTEEAVHEDSANRKAKSYDE